MSLYKSSRITNAGQNLLVQAISGDAKIQFTRIGFGAGEYDSDSAIVGQTELKDERQSVSINALTSQGINTVVCSALLSNKELKKGYRINEIGLFAKDSSKTNSKEIMYAICIAEEGYADYLPEYNGFAPVKVHQSFYIEVADSSDTTILVDDGITATKKYVDNMLATKADNIDGTLSLAITDMETTIVDCKYSKIGKQITLMIPSITADKLPSARIISFTSSIPFPMRPVGPFKMLVDHQNNFDDFVTFSVDSQFIKIERSTGNSEYYFDNETNGGFAGCMITYITA